MSVPSSRAQGLPGAWWGFGDCELNDLMVPLRTLFLLLSFRTGSPGKRPEVSSLVNVAQVPAAVGVCVCVCVRDSRCACAEGTA